MNGRRSGRTGPPPLSCDLRPPSFPSPTLPSRYGLGPRLGGPLKSPASDSPGCAEGDLSRLSWDGRILLAVPFEPPLLTAPQSR